MYGPKGSKIDWLMKQAAKSLLINLGFRPKSWNWREIVNSLEEAADSLGDN
jgi:hypothetical protein